VDANHKLLTQRPAALFQPKLSPVTVHRRSAIDPILACSPCAAGSTKDAGATIKVPAGNVISSKGEAGDCSRAKQPGSIAWGLSAIRSNLTILPLRPELSVSARRSGGKGPVNAPRLAWPPIFCFEAGYAIPS